MRSVQEGTSTINTPYRPKDTDTKIHGLILLMRKPDTIDAAIPPNLKRNKRLVIAQKSIEEREKPNLDGSCKLSKTVLKLVC